MGGYEEENKGVELAVEAQEKGQTSADLGFHLSGNATNQELALCDGILLAAANT